MTNEEAIKCLECDFYNMECCTEEECKCNEAITMAIEALEKRESIEYVMKLNLQYIDKIANTKDISRKKSIKYIKEHLKASTRSFVDWSEEE